MTPVNLQATDHAKKLLQYLTSIGGRGIVTGQHTQTVAMEEVDKIREITGFEDLNCSPIPRIFAMRQAMSIAGLR